MAQTATQTVNATMATVSMPFRWDNLAERERLSYIDPSTSFMVGKRHAWYPTDHFEDQIWSSFMYPKLEGVFNKNLDRIFGRRRPGSHIKCYMTSTSHIWNTARPTVVASCAKPKYAPDMVAVLQRNPIISRLKSGFDFYADPRAADTIVCVGQQLLPPQSHLTTLCGVRIIIAGGPGTDSTRWKHATLGGLIRLEDAYYGLTAAHTFFEDTNSDDAADDDSVSDGSSSSHPTRTASSFAGYSGPLSLPKSGMTVYIDPATYEGQDDRNGKVEAARTTATPESLAEHVLGELHGEYPDVPWLNRTDDWALIRITESRFQLPNLFEADGRTVRCSGVASVPPRKKVAVAAGFSGFHTAEASGRTVGVLMPNCTAMVSAWTIQTTSEPGDCGSWVMDLSTGELYGMLIASSQQDNCSFYLSMSKIFDSIAAFTGGSKPSVFEEPDSHSTSGVPRDPVAKMAEEPEGQAIGQGSASSSAGVVSAGNEQAGRVTSDGDLMVDSAGLPAGRLKTGESVDGRIEEDENTPSGTGGGEARHLIDEVVLGALNSSFSPREPATLHPEPETRGQQPHLSKIEIPPGDFVPSHHGRDDVSEIGVDDDRSASRERTRESTREIIRDRDPTPSYSFTSVLIPMSDSIKGDAPSVELRIPFAHSIRVHSSETVTDRYVGPGDRSATRVDDDEIIIVREGTYQDRIRNRRKQGGDGPEERRTTMTDIGGESQIMAEHEEPPKTSVKGQFGETHNPQSAYPRLKDLIDPGHERLQSSLTVEEVVSPERDVPERHSRVQDVEESNESAETVYPRLGRMRIPKKLVDPRALVELGHIYDEEKDDFVLRKALAPHNIKEVLTKSADYKSDVMFKAGPRPGVHMLPEEQALLSSEDRSPVQPEARPSRLEHPRPSTRVQYGIAPTVREREQIHISSISGALGQAVDGVTQDWCWVEVPPGTVQISMVGVGGARRIIEWDGYDGSPFLVEEGQLLTQEDYGRRAFGQAEEATVAQREQAPFNRKSVSIREPAVEKDWHGVSTDHEAQSQSHFQTQTQPLNVERRLRFENQVLRLQLDPGLSLDDYVRRLMAYYDEDQKQAEKHAEKAQRYKRPPEAGEDVKTLPSAGIPKTTAADRNTKTNTSKADDMPPTWARRPERDYHPTNEEDRYKANALSRGLSTKQISKILDKVRRMDPDARQKFFNNSISSDFVGSGTRPRRPRRRNDDQYHERKEAERREFERRGIERERERKEAEWREVERDEIEREIEREGFERRDIVPQRWDRERGYYT